MFKKITAAVLCVLAFAATCASAETVQTGNSVTFDENADFRAAAMYDSRDRLVGVQLFGSQTGETDYVKLAERANGECGIRLFAWDENMSPTGGAAVKDKVYSAGRKRVKADWYGSDEAAAAELAEKYSPVNIDGMSIKIADGVNTTNKAELYVNGRNVEWNTKNILKYLINSSQSALVFVDEGNNPDEQIVYYDKLCVNACAYAEIIGITEDSRGDLTFDIDVSDCGEYYYTSFNESTATINVKNSSKDKLRRGNMIKIDYDGKDIFSADTVNIEVLKKAAEGKCISFDEKNMTYRILFDDIDGTDKLDADYPAAYRLCDEAVGSMVELWADDSGKIVHHKHISNTGKYAVLEAIKEQGAEYVVELTLFDGTKKTLQATAKKYNTILKLLQDENGEKRAVQDRVITYRADSYGYLRSADKKDAVAGEGTANKYYVGGIRVNDTCSVLIADADGKLSEAGSLADDMIYTVYGYDMLCNKKYSRIIVVEKPDNVYGGYAHGSVCKNR